MVEIKSIYHAYNYSHWKNSQLFQAVEVEEEDEEDLDSEDISPHTFHLAFNAPRQGVLQVDQSARTLEKVKQNLQVN